ncbi:MAG: helix-turn-helix transcriptional regulator [Alphaproteobacteria bacterium]
MQKTIYSELSMALATLLRALRRKEGLTQEQLGKRLGRPQSFIAKVEAGQRRLDVVELLIIAQALRRAPSG